ncbi:hypothetical protein V5O48_012478, partial [Marasmius crinis-equi]
TYGEIREAPARNNFVEESLDKIHARQLFIRNYNFEVEKKQLSADVWDRFMHPDTERVEMDLQTQRSIQYYLIFAQCSEEVFRQFRDLYNSDHPDAPILSYDQIRRRLRDITGIHPVHIDKCKNNCQAFFGPDGVGPDGSDLHECPKCGESRFDTKGKPRSRYTVIPPALQLQALWRHPDSAAQQRSRLQRTQEILAQTNSLEGFSGYTDILYGSDYLELVEKGTIDENTMVLMYLEDSAQLYRDKESSTLFGIGISGDLPPDARHLESSVMPFFVVGGPKAASHDSFSLPILAHLAACQRHGIKIWDSLTDKVVKKHPFLLFALADTVAMTDMSKSVGHHGRNGCRILCDTPGRHKPNVGTYYPALLRPNGPRVPKSSVHADIPVDTVKLPTVEGYQHRLQCVLDADSTNQYKKLRKHTGIRGPSLFNELPKALPCPKLFPADMMHLYYNLGQLFMQLWRGSIDYTGPEDVAKWEFAFLHDSDDFKAFGRAVERASRCIPTCIEVRIPRNPAEKINSGYKASEYHMLVFGLCPGLLHGRMPDHLYSHFCQLVSATRVVLRRSKKSLEELLEAKRNLMEFVVLFEHYYYHRRMDCLHFVRPCIHALLHIIDELLRVGSLTEVSQWTTERTIANYERRIRLHSDPSGNLRVEIAEQAIANAFYAMFPSLKPPKPTTNASLSLDIGSGYVSKHPRDLQYLMNEDDAAAFKMFCDAYGWDFKAGKPIHRFTRLQLPNKQVARSRWREKGREDEDVRSARNVKLSFGDETRFAEVLYYFIITKRNVRYTLAAVNMYSPPDARILQDSHNVLRVCTEGNQITIIEVKWISEVVAMIPFRRPGVAWEDDSEPVDKYFVVEKTFSDAVVLPEEEGDE